MQAQKEGADLQMLGPRIAFATPLLRTFKLFVKTFPAASALSRRAVRLRRVAICAICTIDCRAWIIFILDGVLRTTSSPTPRFLFWLFFSYLFAQRSVHFRA
jgi:hypothetical protein